MENFSSHESGPTCSPKGRENLCVNLYRTELAHMSVRTTKILVVVGCRFYRGSQLTGLPFKKEKKNCMHILVSH